MNTYPENWILIAERLKMKVGGKCEHCEHPHDPSVGRTLTVHHLDGDKSNCREENLVALCQRCHLSIQAHFAPGQTYLFDSLPEWKKPAWVVRCGL